MTVQEIKERWIPGMKNAQSAVEWWNSKASAFASRELPTADNSLAMRLILNNQMIRQEQTVLDVGCGSGRFSFALEQLGARITGTDFSPRMIEECEKAKLSRTSSVDFCVNDWHNANLHELGWDKHFDLVLANMTPAIVSADTFLKLSEASRNWCLMVRPTRRSNVVLDKLTTMLDIAPDTNALDETLIYAFELLWLSGMKPKIEYEEQIWENTWQVDEAIQEYTLRLSASHTLSSSHKDKIADLIHKVSAGNVVKETTHTIIAAVYWQV
ncbi:methyltransferase family protein [Ruminiclostridium sufflavum DSM 19573]|uniref:Methyltransferase family protein n=1 Tax=Ruminiclostridium sufflavum DSM 19573 TaxID=1121337 RepID=A0A318XS06_9FIRM|nr:class I SAM-dependent methyltransferase [Ruminiclostridium sufflavum]PYG84340.1 methyltransferase family protein [Ruminiclostridium sufflavum DSM 19573]